MGIDRKMEHQFSEVLNMMDKLHFSNDEANKILFITYSALYEFLKIAYANKHRRNSKVVAVEVDNNMCNKFGNVLKEMDKMHFTSEEANGALMQVYSALYEYLKIAYANKHRRNGGISNEETE